jgi:Sec-independent protein translocase protein TatA
MSGIGAPEFIVIFVIALIVFAAATARPGKFPEIDSTLGKGVRDFTGAIEGADQNLKKIDEKREP